MRNFIMVVVAVVINNNYIKGLNYLKKTKASTGLCSAFTDVPHFFVLSAKWNGDTADVH